MSTVTLLADSGGRGVNDDGEKEIGRKPVDWSGRYRWAATRSGQRWMRLNGTGSRNWEKER